MAGLKRSRVSTADNEQYENKWNEVKKGYLPLELMGNKYEYAQCYKPFGTVQDILSILQQPVDFDGFVALSKISQSPICNCTKLRFIVYLIENLYSNNCALDLAIVAGSKEVEDLLVKAISYTIPDLSFNSMCTFFRNTNPPVFGVLIQMLGDGRSRRKNSTRVDHVIVYDTCLLPNREYSRYFEGIHYATPQITALTVANTPDIRVCNYRDTHPTSFKETNITLNKLSIEERRLFTSPFKKRSNLTGKRRRRYVKDTLEKFKTWMLLKDGTMFDPKDVVYRSEDAPEVYDVIEVENDDNNADDGGGDDDNYGDTSASKRVKWESSEESVDVITSVYGSIDAFEEAINEAHNELLKTIYGC